MPPAKGRKKKPQSSPTPSTRGGGGGVEGAEDGEDEATRLQNLLSTAAAKFPKFVTKDAYIGRISEVDSSSRDDYCMATKIWVSDDAMTTSPLRQGDLVSVSLAASCEGFQGDMLLDAFSDVLSQRSGVEISKSDGLGNYFAIATVYSGTKVEKNGVRLSHRLWCTMGFPSTGRSIFLCVVNRLEHSQLNVKLNSTNMDLNKICFSKSKDLYLKLIPMDVNLTNHDERIHMESSHIVKTQGSTSSPRTPLSHQQKISSPSPSPVSSQNKGSSSTIYMNFDLSTIRMTLENGELNNLHSRSASRLLSGRYLLKGSLLSLPIQFMTSMFVVDSVDGLLVDTSSHFTTNQGEFLQSPIENQTSTAYKPEDSVFLINSKTKVSLFETMPLNMRHSLEVNFLPVDTVSDFKSTNNFIPKLGGLSEEVKLLKEIIKFSLSPIASLPRYKGVLLHGPPGTGKTSLASYCAHDMGANFFSINGPDVVGQYYGESEQTICEVFNSARKAAPSVVFIDELDVIAPARKDGGEELSLRMVATLLSLLDDINELEGVLVIAATNRPDAIDPALRRCGRLEREIEIGVPSPHQRLEILSTILDDMCHSLNCDHIQSLAFATHGFVGADLDALCNEAAMFSLRRAIASKRLSMIPTDQHKAEQLHTINGHSVSSEDHNSSLNSQLDYVSHSLSKMVVSPYHCSSNMGNDLESNSNVGFSYPQDHDPSEDPLQVTIEDFEKAKLKVRPSAMREVMLELPKVSWEDVGGQVEIKKRLIEAVQWPQMNPDPFKRIGIRPPRGLLLFGPPGCSKTLLARAVASEAKLNFLAVKGPELLSKWVGESEKAVRSLFAKARANSPSIIFFDEIDGLANIRGQDTDGTSVSDRVLSQLLVELDGLDQRNGVTVIAATNRPDKIDPALLRPGRFDRHLEVKPPNASDREAIFHIHMRDRLCSGDVTAWDLACITEGYTGAHIKSICREAAMAALEESFEATEISLKHIKKAIGSIERTETEFYLKMSEKFTRYVDRAP